jgi:hypothetical protein
MASLTWTAATILPATALVVLGSAAFAQMATQTDFDACNRVAQAASGGSGASATPGAASAPTSDANRQINSSGRISSSAGSPGTNGGTTSRRGAAGSPSASPRMSATDMQLTGMAATGHGNAAYQEAYRDCMKRRGF